MQPVCNSRTKPISWITVWVLLLVSYKCAIKEMFTVVFPLEYIYRRLVFIIFLVGKAYNHFIISKLVSWFFSLGYLCFPVPCPNFYFTAAALDLYWPALVLNLRLPFLCFTVNVITPSFTEHCRWLLLKTLFWNILFTINWAGFYFVPRWFETCFKWIFVYFNVAPLKFDSILFFLLFDLS